ncbi:tetratricopeptide repeat protein [Chamaesiphon sp. GL140_3_metabinner_50]|uniref:tetratricopeptide repeat protein n=1 Tax=Chamaesiphon sp. GL140_3_metabinner_50 TaxID=2970812 RepID=UPI0025D6DA06|nr:tetratricopeptide repeat protein [Chamaesiphon sp. GL140_3_metabinner_50]
MKNIRIQTCSMGIAAIISIGQLAGIFATAPAIAADGDLSWRDRNQAQAEVGRLDREITANPNAPNNYNERAMLKDKLGDRQGALADYNRAIDLEPNFTTAYLHRGLFRENRLNFPLGAFLDYNRAVELDPTYVKAYLNRGSLRCRKMNDAYIGIGDLRQAARLAREQHKTELYRLANSESSRCEATRNTPLIAVKPSASKSVPPVARQQPELPKPVASTEPVEPNQPALKLASNQRSSIATPVARETRVVGVVAPNVTKSRIAAPPTPIVATVAPNSQFKQRAIAAYKRGGDRFKDNKKAAIAEYSTAISFDTNYADAYFNRGLARKLTGNKAGAIADLITAANIYRQQQQQSHSDEAMLLVRELKGYKPRPKN